MTAAKQTTAGWLREDLAWVEDRHYVPRGGKKKTRWSHPTNISHQFNTMRGLETWGQTGKPVVCINLAPGRFLSNCSTVKRWVTTSCMCDKILQSHTHSSHQNKFSRQEAMAAFCLKSTSVFLYSYTALLPFYGNAWLQGQVRVRSLAVKSAHIRGSRFSLLRNSPYDPRWTSSNLQQRSYEILQRTLTVQDPLVGMPLAFYPHYALTQWCHWVRDAKDPPRLESN